MFRGRLPLIGGRDLDHEVLELFFKPRDCRLVAASACMDEVFIER